MKTHPFPAGWRLGAVLLLLSLSWPVGALDLLKRYPTTLTAGDTSGDRARPWDFTEADVFRLSRFKLEVDKLRLEIGPADLGIGHCSDGAVWAIVLPRAGGQLTSPAASQEETIAHVWLRFHPKEINRLFPDETVSGDGAPNVLAQMRTIAGAKFTSSWHAGPNAMIPEPKNLTVDVDTQGGPRRFFVVDTVAPSARYAAAFADRSVKPPPAITPELAAEAFDKLWEAFDRDYAMFVLRPEVSWANLRDQYRPKALAAKSAYEFAGVCAEMLKPLRDLHIWLKVAGADVPVFNRPRSANANPGAARAILGELHEAGRSVQWAVTADKVGYLCIYGWNGREVPQQCQEALEEMRGTRGLIVDVRLNGGGSENLAREVAGRFLAKPFVYAYSQFRNGPSHTNLTGKFSRTVNPRGPWRYNRPVVLLIGQKCMSSNESFVGMMTGDPDLTTMGDHTCGSSGNPKMVQLPLDITVSVPRWIDFLPDGTPLDERGFQPQAPFRPTPGVFEGQRDGLLQAALERLRQAPLPDLPIAGPRFGSEEAGGPANLRRAPEALPDHHAEVKEEAADPARPKVISVAPAPDAQGVAPATELRIRFDRPMDPLALKLDWESGGCLACEFPQYDADKHEFSVPVRLAPGALHQIVVNKPWFSMGKLSEQRKQFPRLGFLSADQRLAGLFAWRFRTAGAPAAPGTNAPKATRIVPPPGSEVALLTFAEIQFDQPMAPPETAFPYLVGKLEPGQTLELIPKVLYDPATRTFRLPLLLPPKTKAKFTLAGLRSAAGVLAEPVKLEYQTTDKEMADADRAKIKAGSREPRLLDLLDSMKQKRLQLTSLAERVQTLEMRREEGLFVGLDGKGSSFRWQQPDRYYGDVSQIMMSVAAFRIGCDGRNWWWHYASDRKEELVMCPVNEMHTRNLCLCDPFGLTRQSPAEAAAESDMAYAGSSQIAGADCHTVEAWHVKLFGGNTTLGELFQWHIDPQTLRPAEVRHCSGYGMWRTRFLYDAVNQPLPPELFAPPKLEGISPSPPEPLGEGYTKRFVNLRDGSGGEMSVRWGKTGPKGRSSSGLN
jgi:hypothetical protein